MAEIIAPIIHLNGDRRETLMTQLEQAYTAVRAAMDALRQCAGNRRNFYPESGRWEAYRAQHHDRWQKLQAVRTSLLAEAKALQEQPSS